MKIISNLKLYLVKLDSKRNIKDKVYSDNCQIGGINRQFITVIIYDECTFFANDKTAYR